MNVLVVGQGGREHALVRALRLSPSVKSVHALPGSDGMALEARCHEIDWRDFALVGALCRREAIDLVVIGPEVPLDGGLSDALRALGVRVVGPDRAAARLESSKIFSKEFMLEAGVPTARSFVVSTVEETLKACRHFAPPYVLKADGLAAGKGVFICKTEADLLAAARSIFEERSLGEAGATALLEEFSPGYEISYLVLTNGEGFEPLILARDHKRLRDGDEGPNTGGMGVVAPIEIDRELRAQIDREVVAPSIALLKKRDFTYRGVLFIGLMITDRGPSVLEYNVRFGDPETQVILPLMAGDWGQALFDLADGQLPRLSWKRASACCVVLAAEGYPDTPVKGAVISGLGAPKDDAASYVLHAGTALEGGEWVTAGGRVLNALGLGATLREAIGAAYQCANQVKWRGQQRRGDIGRTSGQS